MIQWSRTFGTALAAMALSVTMVTGAGAARVGSAPAPVGGVYRSAVQDLKATFTDGFDPTGEYSGLAWGLYSQLLLRTLVSYRHVDGVVGTVVVPDLAAVTGQVSPHGLTYTFHLDHRRLFGTPLDLP